MTTALSAASHAHRPSAAPVAAARESFDLTSVPDDDFVAELRRRIGDKRFEADALDFVTLSQGQLLKDFKLNYQEGVYAAASLAFLEESSAAEIEDSEAFEEARAWWQRGDKREALHYLENALGNDFYGLERVMP